MGKQTDGLDMITGTVGDMESLGIYESLKVKLSVLENASEAAGKKKKKKEMNEKRKKQKMLIFLSLIFLLLFCFVLFYF